MSMNLAASTTGYPSQHAFNDSEECVNQCLDAHSRGDKHALTELFPFLYDELKKLADYQLSTHQQQPLLQTTDLVHDVYERLAKQKNRPISNKRHFLSICTYAMRQIIIDQYRKRNTLRRGGNQAHAFLENEYLGTDGSEQALWSLSDALTSLAKRDHRMMRVFELSYFGALSALEISQDLKIEVRTVYRLLSKARTWIFKALSA